MEEPATGTVTFLFTDIEGSTRLLRALGDRYPAVLLRQRALIEAAAATHGGRAFGTEGDAVFLVFHDPSAALRAAASAQRGLGAEPWPPEGDVRVRMGIHTGEATRLGDDYVGLALHETARVAAAGHGGQVLVSAATAELTRRTLPEELGLRDVGDHRLKDLAGPQRLYQLAGPELPDRFPALRTLEGRPNNLPSQLTSFVGRDHVARAVDLLGRTRLLTLTGPGGTGKTRLALQVAAETLESYPDGAWFVALETVTDPGQVAAEVLASLQVLPAASQPPLDRLLDHLRDRQLLLVLDNLEQVVSAGPVVVRLLRDAPGLRVVATSRIPLHVSGEQELPVPPLAVPGDAPLTDVLASEAVRLFVERAMAVHPGFTLDAKLAPAIVDIVRRLDGLPLAIELAAARVRTLSVEAIRARLGEALRLLTGGARDLSARQQTLRGAMDWSHDLLDGPERLLFSRLGVFSGGGELDLVESVCGDARELGTEPLDGLESLADKSLLRSVTESTTPRYAMLVTIREYALERLTASGEAEVIRERHRLAFLRFAEMTADELTGADAERWLDRVAVEHDNLRAAIDGAVADGDAETAMRIATAIWRFWQMRGHLHEAEARFAGILSLPSGEAVSARVRARALGAAGSISYWRGDYPAMRRRYVAAVEEALRCGDPRVIADAQYNLGFAPADEAPAGVPMFAHGVSQFRDALTRYRELGDRQGSARSAWALGVGELYGGSFEPSRVHSTEALGLAREVGDRFTEAWALWHLALLDLVDEDLDASVTHLDQALRAFVAMTDHTGPVLALYAYSVVARRQGDRIRYWTLRGIAERLRRETGADLVRLGIPSIDWHYDEEPTTPDEQAAFQAGMLLDETAGVALALERTPATDHRSAAGPG